MTGKIKLCGNGFQEQEVGIAIDRGAASEYTQARDNVIIELGGQKVTLTRAQWTAAVVFVNCDTRLPSVKECY